MTGDIAKVRCIAPCGAFNGMIRRDSRKVIMMKISKSKRQLAQLLIDADAVRDADGWIEWGGGECPVEAGSIVDVRYRDGRENFHVKAMSYDRTGSIKSLSATCWGNINVGSDIVAYRPHKPDVKPEFCESVIRCIPEPEFHEKLSPEAIEDAKFALMSESIEESKRKPTIEQLAQDCRNKLDFAKRKQAEEDEAAAMRDERWQAVQDRAGEMGVTVELCESVAAEHEQVKPVKPVKPVMTGKFRNAKIGSPKHYLYDKGWSDEICDECGRRFGDHFDTNCN